MSKTYLTFLISLFSTLAISQFDKDLFHHYPDELKQTISWGANAEPHAFRNEVVLDSMIWLEVKPWGAAFIIEKDIYSYDDQARVTKREEYLVSLELYLRASYQYSYFGNVETEILAEALINPDSLEYTERKITTRDPSGIATETQQDDWDNNAMDWSPLTRSILSTNTPSLQVETTYRWNADSSNYVLTGKREVEIDGLDQMTTHYSWNGINYVPVIRWANKYDPNLALLTDYLLEFRDTIAATWNPAVQTKLILDINNYTGIDSVWSIFGATPGFFEFYGFSEKTFNDQWLLVESIGYQVYPNGNFILSQKNRYDYTSELNLEKNRFFEHDGSKFVQKYQWEYYYSPLIASSTKHIEQSSLELHFQNPNLGDGFVRVSSLEQNSGLEFWLTDQRGVLIDRKKVQSGDQIPLALYNLNRGLYYMTLFQDSSPKTWKLLIN